HKTSSIRPETWASILALPHHLPEQLAASSSSSPARAEFLPLAARFAHSHSGTALPLATVQELYARILVNTFEVTTPSPETSPGVVAPHAPMAVGLCLDATLAAANHSCAPRCSVEFAGRAVLLVAEKEVREGDELTVS